MNEYLSIYHLYLLKVTHNVLLTTALPTPYLYFLLYKFQILPEQMAISPVKVALAGYVQCLYTTLVTTRVRFSHFWPNLQGEVKLLLHVFSFQ